MKGRRAILKAGLAALGSVLVSPLESVLAASTSSASSSRPTAAEEKIIRAFYGQGWSEGNTSAIAAHPAAQQCARLHDRFRTAFPDLRVDVGSIQRVGEEIRVSWVAHGTNRGALGGAAATGRAVSIEGTSKMRIVDGKIISANADWSEAALQKQLGASR